MKITAGSDILYHGTLPKQAVSILRDQAFRLKSSFMNEFESKLGNNLFYLSTARSLASQYLERSFSTQGYIIFQLDGRQLATRYRVKPVMYYRRDYGKNEMEDRVFSEHPTIPLKYVTAIHVPTGDNDYTKPNSYAVILKRLALKAGIPIYFYATTHIRHFRYPKVDVRVQKVDIEKDNVGYISDTDIQRLDMLRTMLLPINILRKHDLVKNRGYTLLSSGELGSYSYFESVVKSLAQAIPLIRQNGHDYTDVIDKMSRILRKNRWTPRELYMYLRAKLEYALTGYTYFDLITIYQNTEPDLSKDYLDKGQQIASRWASLTRALYTLSDDTLIGEKQVYKETGNRPFPWTNEMNDNMLRQISGQYRAFHDHRSKT